MVGRPLTRGHRDTLVLVHLQTPTFMLRNSVFTAGLQGIRQRGGFPQYPRGDVRRMGLRGSLSRQMRGPRRKKPKQWEQYRRPQSAGRCWALGFQRRGVCTPTRPGTWAWEGDTSASQEGRKRSQGSLT